MISKTEISQVNFLIDDILNVYKITKFNYISSKLRYRVSEFFKKYSKLDKATIYINGYELNFEETETQYVYTGKNGSRYSISKRLINYNRHVGARYALEDAKLREIYFPHYYDTNNSNSDTI